MIGYILKGLTLSLFVILIVAFVAYRAGYLDGIHLRQSDNSAENISDSDTGNLIHDSTDINNRQIETMIVNIDTTINLRDTSGRSELLLHSSKSVILLTPEDIRKNNADSIKPDTLTK